MWRNWQTRWLQVPVGATPWRFKSSHPHFGTSYDEVISPAFFTNDPNSLVHLSALDTIFTAVLEWLLISTCLTLGIGCSRRRLIWLELGLPAEG